MNNPITSFLFQSAHYVIQSINDNFFKKNLSNENYPSTQTKIILATTAVFIGLTTCFFCKRNRLSSSLGERNILPPSLPEKMPLSNLLSVGANIKPAPQSKENIRREFIPASSFLANSASIADSAAVVKAESPLLQTALLQLPPVKKPNAWEEYFGPHREITKIPHFPSNLLSSLIPSSDSLLTLPSATSSPSSSSLVDFAAPLAAKAPFYLELPPEQRRKQNALFYKQIYPLVTEKPTDLSGLMVAMSGETLSILRTPEGFLKVFNRDWSLSINSNGETLYQDHDLLFSNEEELVLAHTFRKAVCHPSLGWGSGTKYADSTCFESIEKELKRGISVTEQLLFKQHDIKLYLSNQKAYTEKMCRQLIDILRNVPQVFKSDPSLRIADSLSKQPMSQSLVKPASAAASAAREEIITTQMRLVSPALAADSSVTVQHREEENTSSFSMIKESSGRGNMRGSQSRNVEISLDKGTGKITLTLDSSFGNDIEAGKKVSSYEIEIKDGQVLYNAVGGSSKYELSFIGIDISVSQSQEKQGAEQIRKESEFLMRVLSTWSDLLTHPYTMVVEQRIEHNGFDKLHYLGGKSVSPEDFSRLYIYGMHQGVQGHRKINSLKIEGSFSHLLQSFHKTTFFDPNPLEKLELLRKTFNG